MAKVDMKKFFKELHLAEFGYTREEFLSLENLYCKPDPRHMIDLLERARDWRTHENLIRVCAYLGAESDDRIDTIEGCHEIIREDIEYWKGELDK